MNPAVVKPRSMSRAAIAAALALTTGALATSSAEAQRSAPREPTLPVVFVHGGAGSAAQYETQAMRWASNEYPNLVTAIDRTSSAGEAIQLQLDAFFADVMAQTGAGQIYVVAHSLGVAIMNDYLNSSPERTARVAKYIGIDSSSAGAVPVCPGTPAPVPCKGIYRSENAALMLGDENVYLDEHGHTQAVTSEQSFVEQYEFFLGRRPATTLVLPERPDEVEIAGRVINFPANTGLAGATLQIWEVDGFSGARERDIPDAEIALDASGAFGPIPVDGRSRYEFSVLRDDVDYEGHVYYQPFLRDDYLIRLLASPPGAAAVENTARSPDHASAVVIRYKEWWADQGESSDRLWTATRSRTWDHNRETPAPSALDLLGNPEVAPRAGSKISIHVHDADGDKVSTLAPIPFFASQVFQAGVDAWLPATTPPDGITWFMSAPRGDRSKLQIISLPNWASDRHRIGIQFNDYAQEIDSWSECLRARPSPCRKSRFARPWSRD